MPRAKKNRLARRTHRYDLNAKQVDLITRTIAKGATPDELQLFLWVAKRHRLDPFTRQLHMVKRKDNDTGQMVATIQVGIDGYRQMASRYPDFGSTSEAEYGPTVGKYPEWARVKVFKKGLAEPSVGVAYWSEYAPNMEDKKAFMWRKMPKHMLAKCAEAIALRKAYPDLADIYTDDEMARTNSEYAPSGRHIAEEPEIISGKALEAAVDRYDEKNPALKEFERKEAEQLALLKNETIDVTPKEELFYIHHAESDTYEVNAADEVKKKHRLLLKPLFNKVSKTICATGEQLENLKIELERAGAVLRKLNAK